MRRVQVRPFLCAETPLLERHARLLGVEGDPGNAHGVLRVEGDAALAALGARGLRLLTEAEWEWVARAAGERAYPFTSGDADAWAEASVGTPVDRLEHPLGVLALGWGEWVDDGWHPTYRGAPATSDAWEPRTRLQLARGGALAVWPWQTGGELVLTHAAMRERAGPADVHAVRAALDLPPR